ncbi:TetR family transcriptional regulator [Gordonia sp. i37]|uniref:TetR/AcrR family transcriptional regulator n=1 Tax=Gordonia sp. i37 TaxID=1961707 RepID=UPI0009AE37BF|nr:TetR family transcriptional regulator [Gordonia sp. i37]OPX16469.1 TetR family transcriptional regulator [Gordonia sp. i37]
MRLSVAERRRLAIEATLRVIATEGVESATTRRIALEAGVPQSGLFYAFDSRDELLAAVAEHGINEELDALNERIGALEERSSDAPLHPREVIRAGFESFAGDVVGNATREHALISLGLFARRTTGLEPLAEYLYARYTELVIRMLREGARLGGFRWAIPEEQIAPAVVAAADGLTLGYVMTGDPESVEHTTDAFVRMLGTYVTS